MGYSSWIFLIKNKDDLQRIFDLIKTHNDSPHDGSHTVGETLNIEKIFEYKLKKYLYIYNYGGRDSTTSFILKNCSYDDKIYFPFNKPKMLNKYLDKGEFIWKPEKENDFPPDIFFEQTNLKKFTD